MVAKIGSTVRSHCGLDVCHRMVQTGTNDPHQLTTHIDCPRVWPLVIAPVPLLRASLYLSRIVGVIVMIFRYVLERTYIFLNFLNFYSSLGIDHDPHVLYVHMTYDYSFSLCFFLHTTIRPREVVIVL